LVELVPLLHLSLDLFPVRVLVLEREEKGTAAEEEEEGTSASSPCPQNSSRSP
jgi:hypothetical protein